LGKALKTVLPFVFIIMLQRVLEIEAMDSVEEALDYNSMDHDEVNRIFAADLLAAGLAAEDGEILDLGTGTALIPIELCRMVPNARVLAVDVAEHMLALGRQNIDKAGLTGRIRLERVDAKRLPYRDGQFATVISNSIVHHLPNPSTALNEAWRVTASGGLIFFRDLFRPNDEDLLWHLVEIYAAGANQRQQQMLADSFRAALTVEEVRELIISLGAPPESVYASSDRHWTWAVRKNTINKE
jgi:ubiquinone/menaquinone biosynthesis C-methylase UbiE